MRLSQFKKGKMSDYSFKDLEHGVKRLYKELEEVKIAIKIIKRVESERGKTPDEVKRYVLPLYDKRKEDIEGLIKKGEEELSERLLIGNDDGAVERDLLGDKYV